MAELRTPVLLAACSPSTLYCPSGVTRVGDTPGGNWGCPPLFFSWKTWQPFLLIAVTVTIAFYCFHSGVTLSRVGCHLFYLSDLVSPLFFVNLPTKFFFFGCHPLEGVTRGGPHPLVTPLYCPVLMPCFCKVFQVKLLGLGSSGACTDNRVSKYCENTD